MRCVYCNGNVVGDKTAVTIQGGAPAHANCHEFQLLSQRVFKNLKLTALTDVELNELQDLVKVELNSRAPQVEAVELF